MTRDDIVHMAGEEVLRVTAKDEFIWHENADEMIESADYSQYPALRHVLKTLREAERIKAENERLRDAVAAEREAIGNIILDYAGRDDLSDSDESLLKHLFELIRARGET